MSMWSVQCAHCGREFYTNAHLAVPQHDVHPNLRWVCPGVEKRPAASVRVDNPMTYRQKP